MKYYLETNSLVNSSRLLEVSAIRDVCLVSVHGIMELATDLNDEVFGSKQAVMRRILQSSVEIDWRLPQKIIFDAFGINSNYSIAGHDVSQIMKAMANARDKREFIECIKESGLDGFYEIVKQYDSQYNKYLPAVLANNFESLDIVHLRDDAKNSLNLFEDSNDQSSDSFNREFRQGMIRTIAQKVSTDLAESSYNSCNLNLDQILANYDNTLDTFLGVFFYTRTGKHC